MKVINLFFMSFILIVGGFFAWYLYSNFDPCATAKNLRTYQKWNCEENLGITWVQFRGNLY